jgi:hypothetical protein
MAVGIPITKTELDSRAGNLARAFQDQFGEVVILQEFLLGTPDPDLIELGYTSDDVATLKTAMTDLAQLGRIWIGSEPLPTAKDFRVFVKRLWGIGAF